LVAIPAVYRGISLAPETAGGIVAKKTARKSGAKKTGASKRKTTAKGATKRRAAAKREMIDTGSDKRFVRRSAKGRFKESDDVGRSLTADRRKKAKTKVRSGPGGQGRPVSQPHSRGASAEGFRGRQAMTV
jgi:hypothetical protein